MNKRSYHPLNEADEKNPKLSFGEYIFGGLLETLCLTEPMPLPGYDLSLALSQSHRLCWVLLLPQAVLLAIDPHRGGGNMYLYSETNTWISSPHISASPQSSNWQANFSQNFVLPVTQARTSRGHIPWAHGRFAECPLTWLDVRGIHPFSIWKLEWHRILSILSEGALSSFKAYIFIGRSEWWLTWQKWL